MNQDKILEEMKKDYDNIEIPELCLERIQMGIDKAKLEKKRESKKHTIRNWAISVTAAAIVLVVLPNTNQSIALAMEKIPIIGSIVKVVTFHRYEVKKDTMEAKVEVPQIETEEGKNETDGVKAINDDIKAYTDKLIESFKKDMEKDGQHKTLDISYKVITDTKTMFSLKISVLETMASAAETVHYYHLDKETGEVIKLKDLFKDGADYVTAISDYIKDEMRERMKDENMIYFIDSTDLPEEDFKKIKQDQNFYFKKEGSLVIAFDEYEVAPGYMGSQEFEIPNKVIKDILK